FETGAAPRLEVLAADLGVTRAETDLDLARSQQVAARAGLNAVLNLPPAQPTLIVWALADAGPPIAYEPVLTQALASNTDLLTLARKIAVEQKRVALLRAERTPTPVFSVHTLFNSPPDFNTGVGFAVNVDLPLFARNQGPIAESIATTSQLRARREDTQRDV